MNTSFSSGRPLCILIAAMGGEGGGVLTGWIVDAAERAGYPVQSTSIPGVAQRTGATTYYIEIWPEQTGKRPVMCLNPMPGQVDVMIASEFVEAGRAIANGYVSPDRTLLIASTHRIFAVAEKSAMADGRYDVSKLFRAAKDHARRTILFDMDQAAKDAGSILNAVLLGALAGSGALPLPSQAFEDGIRAEGKAVDSNLAGFRFGLSHGEDDLAARAAVLSSLPPAAAVPALADRIARLPLAVQTFAAEGIKRLIDYQGEAYARLYLDRLDTVVRLGDEALANETARHLALRMSFEDVIRVAQLKLKPERFDAIAREQRIRPGQPYMVAEFLKPGVEEIASLLPPALARRIIALSDRRGWTEKFHLGMTVQSNRVGGYLRLRLLASLRGWRPRSFRYAEEQARIEDWLDLIRRAAGLDPQLAREIVDCARLIKGYGDTFKRGAGNFERIRDRVILPALEHRLAPAAATDALVQARTAALADPDGQSLGNMLADFEASLRPAIPQAAE
ncbi:MAG: indolepyruvate oxidoreductase subunit beta family protein [Ferrovibrio sp.]|uniref:indolepyruvate oxidoreductase subunit beta family protein n=1 Tax=Ferrovibrio sp. TaxID=1917215 RepID=UPI002636079F|nr:indolepyruvate oxidoreductase subunit beta family protein [Ferrovibrio sp.]MCW0233187.1 indolepyruvate oxidoreductase subunit beta family protein [Ferrovibrio sp.]